MDFEIVVEINSTMPQTEYTADSFPYTGDGNAIMTLGLVCATMRHLIRSYVEQPDVANSPVAYHNRQQYLERWQSALAGELERYEQQKTLWKARSFDLNRASVLLGSKAGRMLPGYMRTRSIGRGWN